MGEQLRGSAKGNLPLRCTTGRWAHFSPHYALTNCKGSVFPHGAKGKSSLALYFPRKICPTVRWVHFSPRYDELTKGSVFLTGKQRRGSAKGNLPSRCTFLGKSAHRANLPTVRWVHFSPDYALAKGSVFPTGKQRCGNAKCNLPKGNLPSCCTFLGEICSLCGGSIFTHNAMR